MFFKKLILPEFQSIKLIARPIENVIKFWLQSAWLNRCSIGAGSIEFNFWSIESNFRSIENWSEIFFLLKKKKSFSHMFFTLFKLFKKLFALSLRLIHLKSFFVVFFLIFLKGFSLQVLVRLFLPLLFHFLHIFHAF